MDSGRHHDGDLSGGVNHCGRVHAANHSGAANLEISRVIRSLVAEALVQGFVNLLHGYLQEFVQQVRGSSCKTRWGSSSRSRISSSARANTDNPYAVPQGLVNLLQSFGIGNSQLAHDPTIDLPFDNIIASLLQHFGINWSPAGGTINGATYDSFANPGTTSFWIARTLELFEDFQNFAVDLTQNPVQAFQWLISWQLFDFPATYWKSFPIRSATRRWP